jgi:membrane associated rhomboid family serine protease
VGLSGVLHAGVVIVALANLHHPIRASHRVVGTVLLAWVAGKLFMENPWAHHLVLSEASAINVAPWAHLSGALAGALAWSAVHANRFERRHSP